MTGVIPIENPEGVDALTDSLFGNGMATFRDRSGLSALPIHENLSLSKVITRYANPPENFDPKFISWTFLPVKLGKLPELLELLSSWNVELDHRCLYNISVPMRGPVSSARVTYLVESFASYEDLNGKIFSDLRMNNLRDLIVDSGVRSLGRITFRNTA